MQLEGKRNISLNLDTSHCYVCGPENPIGFQVPFVRDGGNGSRAVYTARSEHCGWPGLLHGGVTLTLMDEALAWALYFQGLYGVTARLEVRLRQPISVGAKVIIRAWTLDRRRRVVNARAEIRFDTEGNPLIAEATATMYLQKLEVSEKG
ncbi:MAG: PaaI family thioesterase [Acidobacteria bacterium]|nr:PaaI family thioesterase [Acidobacteriota bacterium]